jgi:hypothetical protein
VQRKLNRLGHGAGAVDGLFGPVTDAAVRRFQADSGLVVDGAVGPRTLRKLRSRIRQEERLLARGSGFRSSGGSERVREVQRKLNRLGHGAGAVDGLFGPVTDAAVRRFQNERALVVDGLVGPRTLAALGSTRGPIRQRARTEQRVPERVGRVTPSPRARSNDPAARRGAPQPDVGNDPLQNPIPASPTDQTEEGPRWGVLLLGAAVIGLLIVVALASWTDSSARVRRAGEDDDWGDEQEDAARPGIPPTARPADPLEALGAEVAGAPDAEPLLGVGALADLASSPAIGAVTGTVYVELLLFAESRSGRCETELLDGGAPFSVAAGRLEEDVRAIVVPKRLPTLARALRNAGRGVEQGELERLPFMLELSPELEAELVRRTAPAASQGSRSVRQESPSAGRRAGRSARGGRR